MTTVADLLPSPASSSAVDVVVVGGGPAGLSAATVLARSRRSVVVVDAGEPRNAPADGVHAFLGHDGVPPGELLARGRAEVERYGGRLLAGSAVGARLEGDGVVVDLDDGRSLRGRHVVVTTGLVDELPPVAGLREQWGRGVIHCPYCHGWEVRDRRVVVLATTAAAMHQAELFGQLTDDLAVVVHEPTALDASQRDRLRRMGVDVVEGKAVEVRTVDGVLSDVVVEGAGVVRVEAVVVGTTMVARSAVLEALGVEAEDVEAFGAVLGRAVPTDPTGRTSVDRVWAAGNVTDPSAQVVMAAAAGTRTGAMVNHALVQEDLARRLGA